MATIGGALRQARGRLAAVSDTPYLDAQVLLADLLGVSRSWLLAHADETLEEGRLRAYRRRVDRCAAGEPLPYVLGWWEFYGRRFAVGPQALIPRPETELLVERALEWLGGRGDRRRVLDVGTGSGCIAVTLACERPELVVLATDRSLKSLKLARLNAHRHDVGDRVWLLQADLAQGIGVAFDLVCANLPYIPSQRLARLRVARHEPRLALDGGSDGMAFIGPLIRALPRLLARPGLALLEVGPEVSAAALARAVRLGRAWRVVLEKDLAGLDRLLRVERAAG